MAEEDSITIFLSESGVEKARLNKLVQTYKTILFDNGRKWLRVNVKKNSYTIRIGYDNQCSVLSVSKSIHALYRVVHSWDSGEINPALEETNV